MTFLRKVWFARLWIVIGPVYLYKFTLSRFIGGSCRFQPTCSSYMIDAVQCYGLIKGTIAGTYRILRCNPWCKGGEDPAQDFRFWWSEPQGQTSEGISKEQKNLSNERKRD